MSMSSAFATRLGTNYCPKDEEVLEIQGLLVEPTLRLKHLDDEIADLQKAIEKLAEERDSLGAYVEAHKALISPARRLPLDIIQEIFVACLPTHRNCVMSALEAPVLLGRICSAWRAISLSTPRLWASLHIAEPTFYVDSAGDTSLSFEQKVEQRLELAKIWLDRSGSCPLSISLQSARQFVPQRDIALQSSRQFIEALIPFASRWQQINFTIPVSTLLSIISRLEADTPLLETITFHTEFHLPVSGRCGAFGILRGPRIRSFSVPAAIFVPDLLPLGWSQLTNLSIGESLGDGLMGETILRTLSCCPELRRCRLVVNDFHPATGMLVPSLTSGHPGVELPFLHTLQLHFGTMVYPAVSLLFERLSFPQLHTFTLRGPTNVQTANESNPALIAFLMRSTCLESLDIDCGLLSKPSLLECLRALPSTIHQLQLRSIRSGWEPQQNSLDDDVLAALTPAPNSAAACSDLRHLSLQNVCDITDAAILRFITARMAQSRTLARIECQFERRKLLDILPSLQSFIEAGLDVSLQYPEPLSLYSPWNGLPDTPQPPGWSPTLHLPDQW
ncbi:hypothetical protein DFH06DRAFT_1040588 [Mycena polygramma]|nr:hypothetical protein DFH06DRAFT_1040588 [Mycena polygramma]